MHKNQSKSPAPQGKSLLSCAPLLQQLELVQQFAEAGFWITTTELAHLLELEVSFLIGKAQFPWRNFVCTQVAVQADQTLWQVTKGSVVSLPAAPATVTPPDALGEVTPSTFAQIENFLTPRQWEDLLAYVRDEKEHFVGTTNSAGDQDYRKSMVLYQFPRFSALLVERVRQITPHILTYFNHPPFAIANVECQLTMHNDGNYYRIHNDNGSPDCADRVLTYVYYFYREPKAFSGGELRLYNMQAKNGYLVAADSYQDIQPLNNSIVFFFSQVMHEVLPIACPSRDFADSRFTINGWVRRA